MTGWWKAITKNTHNADWVSDLVEVENSIGGEDTADVSADDLVGKKHVALKICILGLILHALRHISL